jgi:hypothetical protein
MNPNDWVMTNEDVGQLWVIGGMYCQINIIDLDGKTHPKIVPTDEIYPITKEVADIMRSV